jgi:hypothetical protein
MTNLEVLTACSRHLGCFGSMGGNALSQSQEWSFDDQIQRESSQEAEREVSEQGEPSAGFD